MISKLPISQVRLKNSVSEGDHWQGSENAPLTLLKYGDYESLSCLSAYRVVKQLQETLENRLRFVFRNFPLAQIHPRAMSAAHAAEAAAFQNSFWEMHDLLYENQDELNFYTLAEILELDLPEFVQGMNSEEVIDRIQNDIYSGVRSGVNNTPTYFINGYLYQGENSYEGILSTLIEMMNMGDAEAG